MIRDFSQPRPGVWINSGSGRPLGRVISVGPDCMHIVDVDNEMLQVNLSHILSTVNDVLVLDCELRSLRAEQARGG